jgi:ATP-binding cassette subfamily B protein
MLAGALAEIATIGAVLPFLQIVTDPAGMANMPVIGRFFSGWEGADARAFILPAAALLVLIAAVSTGVRLLLLWKLQKYTYALSHDLGMEIFRKSIRQPYSDFVKRHSSEVLAALEKVNLLANSVILSVMQAASSFVIATFIIIALFLIEPFVAISTGLFIGGLFLVISVVTGRALRRMSKRAAAIIPRRLKEVEESTGGLRDIILDQSHAMFERRFERLDGDWRTINAKANFVANSPRLLVEGAGLVLVAGLAVYYNTLPGGVVAALPILGAFAIGAQRLLPLVQTVYVGWSQLSAHAYSVDDVIALLNWRVQPALPRPRGRDPEPFGDSIELRHLTFGYGDGQPALVDINLTIHKGARIGFVGKTGSGKSTLLDVIMGLLEPSSGQVLLGGTALDHSNMQNWQAQIAHVPQSIFLADDSIMANIAFGAEPEHVDAERVREAARRAGLAAFIEQLPDGYETAVGERGVRLSGGQRQRIGIARALYKRATVLILDEATSALDDQTEAAVMEAITDLDRDMTILMIAHRLSTVAMCDMIVRLEDGRIVERGSYDQVIGRAA